MSKARGAVPGQCQSCDVLTTDIRLIPLIPTLGPKAIQLLLICTPCARHGVRAKVEDDGTVTVEKRLVSSGTY